MQVKITEKGSAICAKVNKMQPELIVEDSHAKDSFYEYLGTIRAAVVKSVGHVFGALPALDVPVDVHLSDEKLTSEYLLTPKDLENWVKNAGDCLPALLDGHYLKDDDLREVLKKMLNRNRRDGDKNYKPKGSHRMSCLKFGDYRIAPEPTITIYYRNLPSYGDPSKTDRFVAELCGVYAHEYFHHVHHHWRGGVGLFGKSHGWKKEVVIESLADYFAYLVLTMGLNPIGGEVAGRRYDSWHRFFGSPWPYAYALCIGCVTDCLGKFEDVFKASRRSWDEAYKILTDGWNIRPYSTRVMVNPSWTEMKLTPPRLLRPSEKMLWERLCEYVDTERDEHGRACFHVCQKNEWKNESKGGYIFAPNDNGKYHKTVSLVRKGDLIIHHWGDKIRDVSIAISDARIDKNPSNGETGWVVDCLYLHIAHEVDTTAYTAEKIKYGSCSYFPFTVEGNCKQGYLTVCPYELGHLFYNLAIKYGIDY